MSADRKDEKLRDYEIGYRKPPIATKFRKGKSGNPTGGRKREAQPLPDFLEVFAMVIFEPIFIREGNQTKRMSRLEAFVRSLCQKAMQGNATAQKQVTACLKLLSEKSKKPHAGLMTTQDAPPHDFSWSEAQERLYQELKQDMFPDSEEEPQEKKPDDPSPGE